jgi:hypothetical protein
MIMDINRLKTIRVIHASYDASEVTDYEAYRAVVNSLSAKQPSLDHGSAEGLGRVAAELLRKMRGVDYKSLKEIDRLSTAIN